MTVATVDAKGRISLPAEIRGLLGIDTGDALFIEIDEEHEMIHLAKAQNPFDALAEDALREFRAGRTRSLRAYANESGIDLDGS